MAPSCKIFSRVKARALATAGASEDHRRNAHRNARTGACAENIHCLHGSGWGLWQQPVRKPYVCWALRKNSEKRPIGGGLSVLPFLGWLASGFQPGAADLGQLPAESIAVSESLESWN